MKIVIDSLLAPIARLAVAKGVLFAEVAERLKRQFVAAADGADATDSRISVATGLQRRDVARLRAQALDSAPERVNHLSRLVAQWLADPTYRGAPIPQKGAGPSFDALAASIRKDVHPRSMLDALIDAGTVNVAEDGTVSLLEHSYQPLRGTGAQLAYLAQNGGDFLTAATDNILNGGPAHFERAVHYNGLSEAAVAELDAAFRAGQMALLQQINAKAAQAQKTHPGGFRFRAGGYFYQKEDI